MGRSQICGRQPTRNELDFERTGTHGGDGDGHLSGLLASSPGDLECHDTLAVFTCPSRRHKDVSSTTGTVGSEKSSV